MTLSDRAMTFGEVAEEYHRWRPVEPDERMLAVLGATARRPGGPEARRHHSGSTHIPVDDHALDAVLVADA